MGRRDLSQAALNQDRKMLTSSGDIVKSSKENFEELFNVVKMPSQPAAVLETYVDHSLSLQLKSFWWLLNSFTNTESHQVL